MEKLAVIAIIEKDKQYVWVQRQDVPVWVLPGGGVDSQETPQEATIREVYEETGLVVTIEKLVAHYYPLNNLATKTYVYLCRPQSGSLSTGSETRNIGYFSLRNIPKNAFFIHIDWLKEGLEQNELINKPIYQVTYFALAKFFLKRPWWVIRFFYTRYIKPSS